MSAQESLALSLPPLRRKIFRSFFVVVALYGIFGSFFLVAIFLASGITPKILHVNYDSVAAAIQMREALNALRHPSDSGNKKPEEWIAQFEKALAFEKSNITEPGEDRATSELAKTWNDVKNKIRDFHDAKSTIAFGKLKTDLDEIIHINERAMFSTAEEAVLFRNRVLIIAGVIFFLTLIVAVYLADGLANRVASPIKDIAEALRNKPVPGEKLKLPTPSSLEIRILVYEMNQLWKRLSELRKLNIEELSSQRSKLETVLEAVEDGIIVIDASGIVLQCNEGLVKIIGLTREMIVGHRWEDLPTTDEDYLRLRQRLTQNLKESEMIEFDVGHEKRVFGCRQRIIGNRTGETAATLYLLHDVTERKERERLKSEFIAVLSHELKTPLQSLGTASELLLKRSTDKSEEEKMLIETVNEDVARIRAVADDFMQVSFIDPHSLRLKISRHPLSELIQEWIKPFRIVGKDKKVSLKFQRKTPEVIFADIDAVKFPWAISNLLSNAIRFSPTDSEVTVSVEQSTKNILIEIKDDGPGIPDELQKRMFDPYFQAPIGESTIPSGFLGLGLTIAKEVVEAHRGEISYYRGSPKGSVFAIALPNPQLKEEGRT